MTWTLEPVEWAMTYNVYPHDPIGFVRKDGSRWLARLEREELGVFDSGDAAAEAVWRRYVDKSYVQHELAARTHGGSERHTRGK